jgi:SRSO17 transposase
LAELVAMESEARFARYIESLAGVLGHVDRAEPLRGLLHGFADAGQA